MPLITLDNVTKVFATEEVETYALSKVNLNIGKGEFVSITGPSGCGKSTLMSILGTLDSATDGKYTLDGVEVTNADARTKSELRRMKIGFIFQAFNLIGDLSVVENVEVPLTYQKGMSRAERRDRARIALDKVGMGHRINHFPSQLSGGQQQRIAVARALVAEPAIILADEPTGNLDSENGESVMKLLRELHAAGSTLCMVTHDEHHAAAASKRIRMLDGKILG
jgi:putative ABC transport system ATP-binding protein